MTETTNTNTDQDFNHQEFDHLDMSEVRVDYILYIPSAELDLLVDQSWEQALAYADTVNKNYKGLMEEIFKESKSNRLILLCGPDIYSSYMEFQSKLTDLIKEERYDFICVELLAHYSEKIEMTQEEFDQYREDYHKYMHHLQFVLPENIHLHIATPEY